MPFNGSGVFQRLFSWTTDAANNIPISATRTDSDSNDIAAGLTDCITRDGQSVALANLPMGNFRHTGAANPVNPQDYVTLFYGQANFNAKLSYTPVNKAGDTGIGSLGITGTITSSGSQTAGEQFSSGGNFTSTTGNVVLQPTGSGNVILRPNNGSTTGQISISSSGNLLAQGDVSGVNIVSSANFTGPAANAVLQTGTSGTIFLRPVNTSTTGQMSLTSSGIATTVNFVSTSDERKKDQIKPVDPRDHLADLLELTIYVMLETGKWDRGVIAQQVQRIAPEYVYEDDDGFLGVDKAGLALECVMGLAARVRDLEVAS